MTDPLPSIEARLEAGYYDRAFGAGEDVRWLLKEVKRLRALPTLKTRVVHRQPFVIEDD